MEIKDVHEFSNPFLQKKSGQVQCCRPTKISGVSRALFLFKNPIRLPQLALFNTSHFNAKCRNENEMEEEKVGVEVEAEMAAGCACIEASSASE